jgi:hypothetical protein
MKQILFVLFLVSIVVWWQQKPNNNIPNGFKFNLERAYKKVLFLQSLGPRLAGKINYLN